MENEESKNLKQIDEQLRSLKGCVLPEDNLKQLADFFSILIQIDRRITKDKTYGKQNK